jgi:hypothetical protein
MQTHEAIAKINWSFNIKVNNKIQIMKNIQLIPTKDKGRITKHNKELHIEKIGIYNEPSILMEVFNMYITSDDEIKEGDWYCSPNGIISKHNGSEKLPDNWRKIILTTDPSLDGVQAIDDTFLEWFVKNPSCEEVEVENQYRVKSGTIQEHIDGTAGYEYYEYKIIIPKEEPTILKEAKQRAVNYMSLKGALEPKVDNNFFESLKKYFKTTPHEEVMDSWERSKHFDKIGPTVDELLDNTNKQETLEEVKDLDFWKNNAEEDYLKVPISVLRYISELERQQERMYSEEDMREAFIAGGNSLIEEDDDYGTEYDAYMEQWFKQFKNK